MVHFVGGGECGELLYLCNACCACVLHVARLLHVVAVPLCLRFLNWLFYRQVPCVFVC